MIPTAKSKNFHDLSISGIHVIRFSGVELHRLIQDHPYRRINGGPIYDFDVAVLEPEIEEEEDLESILNAF